MKCAVNWKRSLSATKIVFSDLYVFCDFSTLPGVNLTGVVLGAVLFINFRTHCINDLRRPIRHETLNLSLRHMA